MIAFVDTRRVITDVKEINTKYMQENKKYEYRGPGLKGTLAKDLVVVGKQSDEDKQYQYQLATIQNKQQDELTFENQIHNGFNQYNTQKLRLERKIQLLEYLCEIIEYYKK